MPFVLWFNFLAGFAYIVAGVGLWMRRRWAMWLAVAIARVRSCSWLSECMWFWVAPGAADGGTTLRTLVWAGIAAMASGAGQRRMCRSRASTEHIYLAENPSMTTPTSPSKKFVGS